MIDRFIIAISIFIYYGKGRARSRIPHPHRFADALDQGSFTRTHFPQKQPYLFVARKLYDSFCYSGQITYCIRKNLHPLLYFTYLGTIFEFSEIIGIIISSIVNPPC